MKIIRVSNKDTFKKVLELSESGVIGKNVLTRRYYEFIFSEQGDALTPELCQYYFGLDSPQVMSFVNKKLKTIARKYLRAVEAKRVNNMKQRIKREYQIQITDDGTINPTSIIKLLRAQNFRCKKCNCYLTVDKKKNLDHIIPLSKGGAHSINNVQWLCQHCNLVKHDHVEQ